MEIITKFTTYLRESRAELKKVQWPNKKEVSRNTIMVIAISLAVAAFLGLFDYFFNFILGLVI